MVFFFVIRLGGWLMDNKFWANTTTTKGTFIINLACALLLIIGGAILATNAEQFDMGTVRTFLTQSVDDRVSIIL